MSEISDKALSSTFKEMMDLGERRDSGCRRVASYPEEIGGLHVTSLCALSSCPNVNVTASYGL